MWALPLDVKFLKKIDVCVYSAIADEGLRQNDIRYPCYLCGATTKGFSRARDLMRHSECSHNLFSARVEQGKHYECNGLDLVAPTPEKYDHYSDGSHRGKKKLEESEKAEAEKKIAEARTKAGEKAKKNDGASTSKEVNVAELLRRREEQVGIKNVKRVDAKKREELLEQERVAAQKKIQLEEQQKVRDDKKRRVREEWQKQLKITEEERKKKRKSSSIKQMAKTIAQGGRVNTVVAKKVLKVLRRELTSEELDQEFRELNAGQVRANARSAVEESVVPRGVNKKEKSAAVGRRMMRAEEETGYDN